jgi:hypothetical protein
MRAPSPICQWPEYVASERSLADNRGWVFSGRFRIVMRISRPALLLSTLSASTLIGGGSALGLEYQCARGSTTRSIAVDYQQAGERVPCEVVYRKPPQDPDVLWRASSEVGFCESKADELAQTLEISGWACERVQAAGIEPATPAAPPRAAAEEAAPQAESRQDTNGLQENGGPATARRQTMQPRGNGAAPQAPELATGDNAGLEAALVRDINKLKKSSDAEVQIDSAGIGDLNGDGRSDAAALITFDADGADYVQYLIAYVFADGDYQPKASRLIGGRHREIHGGEVRAIESGTILLDLQILKPEDAACCPSGSRKAAFVLEDGELKSLE